MYGVEALIDGTFVDYESDSDRHLLDQFCAILGDLHGVPGAGEVVARIVAGGGASRSPSIPEPSKPR